MTKSQAVLGVVRAVRPSYRNAEDKLAFLVHAYMLTDGFKLVAVGPAAEELQTIPEEASEVGLEGWTTLESSYAFAYTDAEGKRSPVLVKALPISDKLLVHILAQNGGREPETFELDTAKYTRDSPGLAEGYQNVEEALDKLVNALQRAYGGRETAAESSQAKSLQAGNTAQSGIMHHGGDDASSMSRLRDLPTIVGGDDVVPPGMPRDIAGIPGVSGGPALPGGGQRIPGGAYPSGMHIGPNDPMFAGRGPQRPGFGFPEGPFPGVRYDPVNPAGLEGFNAGDFQRDRSFHPDIMPPGRGRGGHDFDSMFG